MSADDSASAGKSPSSTDWEKYYLKLENSPPRPLLLRVLAMIPFVEGLRAIDLGSGAGRDSLHLLQNGWQVTAVDREASALERLRLRLDPAMTSRLTLLQSGFEELPALPAVDLLYASYSLPFCGADSFPQLWKKVLSALKARDTYFAGQFFGPADEWVLAGKVTGHSAQAVHALLSDFEILFWHEQNEIGPTAAGPTKHWHVFTTIARRR